MGKMLFLIDNLEYNGLARQCTVVAREMRRAGHEVRVGVLGREGPLAADLHGAGVPVEALGWSRWLALGAARRFRQLLDGFSPDLVHAWGLPALRVAAAAGHARRFRLRVSRPLPPGGGRLAAADRWLLRRTEQVAAASADEVRRLLALGVRPDRVTAVPPAVRACDTPRRLPPPAFGHPYLLCLGGFEEWKGHYDAIWAFDILHFPVTDYHLVLAGDGPENARLRRFQRGLDARRNIHFLGAVADVSELLRQAHLVWIPSRRCGGVQTTLEALAAGTAVVATRVPELAEVLAPLGEDALVPPNDPPALVRRTRRLLEDDGRRRQLAERGRELALAAHNPEQLVRHYEGLYHKRAG